MNLTNDEKLWLAMILDRAEIEVRTEREGYLRSADLESQLGKVKGLTDKLQFIQKLQDYCMQRKVEGVV